MAKPKKKLKDAEQIFREAVRARLDAGRNIDLDSIAKEIGQRTRIVTYYFRRLQRDSRKNGGQFADVIGVPPVNAALVAPVPVAFVGVETSGKTEVFEPEPALVEEAVEPAAETVEIDGVLYDEEGDEVPADDLPESDDE